MPRLGDVAARLCYKKQGTVVGVGGIVKSTLLVFLLVLLNAVSAQAQTYFGELVLKPLPDGRQMELLTDFGFEDGMQRKWAVPKGWIVDGASIPQPLWSFVGGPFSGKYRDASVVHDYFCDVRRRPWDEVHRVFYDAMLASGVDAIKAKLMYLAVYRFGPRWDFPLPTCPPGAYCEVVGVDIVEEFQPEFNQQEFEELQKAIEGDPNLSMEVVKKQLDRAFLEDAMWKAKR